MVTQQRTKGRVEAYHCFSLGDVSDGISSPSLLARQHHMQLRRLHCARGTKGDDGLVQPSAHVTAMNTAQRPALYASKKTWKNAPSLSAKRREARSKKKKHPETLHQPVQSQKAGPCAKLPSPKPFLLLFFRVQWMACCSDDRRGFSALTRIQLHLSILEVDADVRGFRQWVHSAQRREPLRKSSDQNGFYEFGP